jgi:hypothetical protein
MGKYPKRMFCEYLKDFSNVKQLFSKRKIVLDENADKFGFDEMKQLMKVKNTSEIKGYPFLIKKKETGFKCALKIVPVETKYDKKEHPSYLEFITLKHLTEDLVDKQVTPHITYYFSQRKVGNRCRALKYLNLKKLEVEEKVRSNSNILVAEFVSGGSLDNWVYNQYENDVDISNESWKSLTFQLLYTIHILQDKYKLMHNDFHYGNILIDDTIKPGGYFVYKLGSTKYYIKNNGFIPKLWDFEFAMCYSNKIPHCYPNKFVLGHLSYDKTKHYTIEPSEESEQYEPKNVPVQFNKVYDIHYFLTSLLDLYITQELFDWIVSLYPSELIPDESSSTRTTTTNKSGTKESSIETDFTRSSRNTHSSSQTYTGDDSDTVSSSYDVSESNDKIFDGRLINGVEKEYKLPDALQLLQNELFDSFKMKPTDFEESESIVFTYPM